MTDMGGRFFGMKFFRLAALGVAFFFLTAARPARIITGDAKVFSEPRGDAEVLETLEHDAPIAVSNQPTEGFFKVKTTGGKVGWISASVIQVEGESPDEGQIQEVRERTGHAPSIRRGTGVLISFLGGANFAAQPDVNILFGTTGSRTFFQAGAEFEWRFVRRFGLLLRGEWQGAFATIPDTETESVFAYTATSVPLQLGLNAAIVTGGSFELGFAAMGGVSPLTWIATQDVPNLSGDLPTVANAIGFPVTARLNGVFSVTPRISLMLETGWRFLLTSLVLPLAEGSGSDLWKNPDTQEFIPLSLSNSGPFVGGGLRIHF